MFLKNKKIFVAGGTDLFVRMKDRLCTPKRVIGLENIAKLRGIKALPKGGLHLWTTLLTKKTAFAIFIAVKVINALKRKEEEAPAAPPAPSAEELLLMEIRDLLKERK